jgi:GDPmannose 4,6-dehydratase
MWLMLQADRPSDYVVATGKTYSVRKWVERAFGCVNLILQWSGEGTSEVGKDQLGRILVRVDPSYFRPTEVDLLMGDASKIQNELGWKPDIDLDTLVQEMVTADLQTCDQSYLGW